MQPRIFNLNLDGKSIYQNCKMALLTLSFQCFYLFVFRKAITYSLLVLIHKKNPLAS